MAKSILLMCCVLCTLLLFGCSQSDSTTNRDATTPAAPPKASPAPSAIPTSTTIANATAIGVPECDAFIAAYEACVHDKVPAAARAQFETGVAQWRKSWHDLAAKPQTRATLAGVCKTQLDAAKTSMKAYGCTF